MKEFHSEWSEKIRNCMRYINNVKEKVGRTGKFQKKISSADLKKYRKKQNNYEKFQQN